MCSIVQLADDDPAAAASNAPAKPRPESRGDAKDGAVGAVGISASDVEAIRLAEPSSPIAIPSPVYAPISVKRREGDLIPRNFLTPSTAAQGTKAPGELLLGEGLKVYEQFAYGMLLPGSARHAPQEDRQKSRSDRDKRVLRYAVQFLARDQVDAEVVPSLLGG